MPCLPILRAINSIEGGEEGERERERKGDETREMVRDTGQIFTTNFFHDNCADLVYQSGYAGPSSDPMGNRVERSQQRKFHFSFFNVTIHANRIKEV